MSDTTNNRYAIFAKMTKREGVTLADTVNPLPARMPWGHPPNSEIMKEVERMLNCYQCDAQTIHHVRIDVSFHMEETQVHTMCQECELQSYSVSDMNANFQEL